MQRLVDIEQKMAEGKGKGYERWAKIHNLKQAAKTLTIYQQYGFSSPEQLEAAVATAYQEMRQTSGELKALETKLQGKRELRQQVLAYAKTKPIREGLKAQKSEKARAAYRQAREGREPLLLPEFSCHHLRHTFATRLCEVESNLKVIQSIMGHKNIETTMDVYAEATDRKKEETFENLAAKLDELF